MMIFRDHIKLYTHLNESSIQKMWKEINEINEKKPTLQFLPDCEVLRLQMSLDNGLISASKIFIANLTSVSIHLATSFWVVDLNFVKLRRMVSEG